MVREGFSSEITEHRSEERLGISHENIEGKHMCRGPAVGACLSEGYRKAHVAGAMGSMLLAGDEVKVWKGTRPSRTGICKNNQQAKSSLWPVYVKPSR